jgi:hypothetical protein
LLAAGQSKDAQAKGLGRDEIEQVGADIRHSCAGSPWCILCKIFHSKDLGLDPLRKFLKISYLYQSY